MKIEVKGKKKFSKEKIEMSKSNDFDPLQIHPYHIEPNKPILLVDLGYATFYRFNATKKWYMLAHPEEKDEIKHPDYDWGNNKKFLEKFNKKFVESILATAKKFKIPNHNIILTEDCKSCNNWRQKLYETYKETRKKQRSLKGFDGKKVFEHAFDYTFKAMTKNYGFKLFRHKELESDDINAIITKYYQQKYPKVDVYILASDRDYLQLSNGKLHLIDFKGTIINANEVNGNYHLWMKILTGDKSDDIPPIKFKKKLVKETVKGDPNQYINATKIIAEPFALDTKKLENDLKTHPDLIESIDKLKLNQLLIDFNMIPKPYVKEILKMIQKYV